MDPPEQQVLRLRCLNQIIAVGYGRHREEATQPGALYVVRCAGVGKKTQKGHGQSLDTAARDCTERGD